MLRHRLLNTMEMSTTDAMEMSTTGELMGDSVAGGQWHAADILMSMKGQVAATSALSGGV